MLALCWIAAAVLGLLALVDQRKLWWAVSAWQFRHPEANEPSVAANALGRVVTAVVAVGFALAAITMSVGRVTPYDQTRLDELGRAASIEFSGEFYKYGSPSLSGLQSWVADESGDRVSVVAAGEEVEDLGGGFQSDSRYTDHFELTSADDESVHGCLTTEYDGGLFHEDDVDVSASYDSGPC